MELWCDTVLWKLQGRYGLPRLDHGYIKDRLHSKICRLPSNADIQDADKIGFKYYRGRTYCLIFFLVESKKANPTGEPSFFFDCCLLISISFSVFHDFLLYRWVYFLKAVCICIIITFSMIDYICI